MIQSIRYENFRVLRDATLPLSRLTLLIGPNGSGKSTALELFSTQDKNSWTYSRVRSFGAPMQATVRICAHWEDGAQSAWAWVPRKRAGAEPDPNPEMVFEDGSPDRDRHAVLLGGGRVFSFIPDEIAKPTILSQVMQLSSTGGGLPVVLTNFQDEFPEKFTKLNQELRRWMPEFEQISLKTTNGTQRGLWLRAGGRDIPAEALSDGVLLSIALLTLCNLPNPPPIVALEEPDRGIHPRLLRDL